MISTESESASVEWIEELEIDRRYRVKFNSGRTLDVIFKVPLPHEESGPPSALKALVRTMRNSPALVNAVLDDRAVTVMEVQDYAYAPPVSGVPLSGPPSTRTARSAFVILAWCETLLPKRLRDEDLGDAMEDLARFSREGRPGVHLLVKAISTTLILLVNGVREVVAALAGLKSSRS